MVGLLSHICNRAFVSGALGARHRLFFNLKCVDFGRPEDCPTTKAHRLNKALLSLLHFFKIKLTSLFLLHIFLIFTANFFRLTANFFRNSRSRSADDGSSILEVGWARWKDVRQSGEHVRTCRSSPLR